MVSSAMADSTSARRLNNKKNAIQFATLGLCVFVTDGKVPLIPRYNKLDTDLSAEERERAVEDFMEKHDGAEPVHVGCTTNIENIKRMFRRFPDAVPSIACGPSKLMVLDADSKDNGPELLRALFNENGGVPANVPVIPTRSGGEHLVFADPEGKFTNKAGLLKKQYGTDVRGTGGQFVAPGSIRLDGKTYGTNADKINFLRAVSAKSIPTLPDFVAAKIGAVDDTLKDEVAPSREREIITRLEHADWDAHEHAFDADPTIAEYDLAALKESNAEFAQLYDNPSEDCSTNRFLAARAVMTEWPKMPVEALSIFFSEWEGAGSYTDDKPKSGEYDDRQVAREWLKNQGLSKPSKGEAFGIVRDDDPNDKAAFLANGGTEERWEAWQERLAHERASRLARAGRAGDETEVGTTDSSFAYIEDIRKSEPRHLEWCVKFFIARGTTSVVSGLWGAGKTAVFADIALHVAHGMPYRGRKVKKGVVVYVALENPEDVERRVRAWCETLERAGHEIEGGAFVVHRGPCSLFRPDGKPTSDEKALIRIAKEASEHYGLPVAMIVIDTLSQSITPGNDREHGGFYVNAMQRISAATGANVTSLHHPTKAGEAVRGDGQLQGNVDTVIEVSRDKRTGRGVIEAGSKFRIGDPSKVRFAYRLKAVEIGRDEDGDIIDVVLATPDHAPSLAVTDDGEDEAAPPLRVSDKREDRVAALLEVAAEEAAKLAAEGEPLGAVGLSAATLRDGLNVRRAHFCGLNGTPLSPLNRESVRRVLDTATEEGKIERRKSRFYLL